MKANNIKHIELVYFGERIRLYRLKLGYSQEELALNCKLTINQISLIEAGKLNIQLITLIKLARILPIKIEDIVTPASKIKK